jgi:hypothetical protein
MHKRIALVGGRLTESVRRTGCYWLGLRVGETTFSFDVWKRGKMNYEEKTVEVILGC